jgi:2-polyprenyl-6-methoxyphenol hydroxylase-like FAD-dependent oxidoreductase
LLARAGVEVTVLEKHADFLRDFRGDSVHPTTLDLLDELGLGPDFVELPARRLRTLQLPLRTGIFTIASFEGLPGRHKYIAMVPQWDLLNLLARAAQREPAFRLCMNTEATGLLRAGNRITGVRYRTADGAIGEIRADLTVACDGRGSVLRADSGLGGRRGETPMDVWWYRFPRNETDPAGAVWVMVPRRFVLMLDRGEYWQCATVIGKGADAELRRRPVDEIMRDLADAAPWLTDRIGALRSWDEVKLLDVQLDRLDRWYADGLLCLGDAAHAMSPIGGVGINLAVQDAVAAARILVPVLLDRRPTLADLARVQRRRAMPTILTQGLQRLIHSFGVRPILSGEIDLSDAERPPLPMRAFGRIPIVRTIPAFVIARGFLPEHAPEFARRPPERTV